MDYFEACEATISYDLAKHEVASHGYDFKEFLQDVGIKKEYSGEEILNWLGY